jgi:hypothetical protein
VTSWQVKPAYFAANSAAKGRIGTQSGCSLRRACV